MASIEDVWAIVAVLEDSYGWSEDEIRGFLGENLLRVYAANWDADVTWVAPVVALELDRIFPHG